MNRNSKQELIEIIRHETEENANTNERVATILTALNSDKLEVSEVNNPDSFQIGTVTATTSKVFLGLYVTGENSATISDVTASKSQADEFPFTPVSVGKLRSLIIHAKIDSQIFYLAEGVEGFTAVDPDYDGLFIKKIIATDSGSYVEEDLKQFQLKANEAWVDLALNDTGATIQTVSVHHAALRFNIISAATNIKIGGFRFYATQFLYDGVQITLRNQTAGDLEVSSISGAGIYPINPAGTPIKLKQFESVTLAYHILTGLFYVLKSGGGASFPELGNDGDLLQKDSTIKDGVKWTDSSSLGKNISNSNLTWTADRTQNLSTKKLTFTNGRFSVPTLEMEVTAANSVPNKIWTAGNYLWFTDSSGVNNQLGFDGDCQVVITSAIDISTNTLEVITNKSQHGREVAINNGANAINLICDSSSHPKFLASYTKEGTGKITIVAGAGTTLYLSDGENEIIGVKGSTFCIKRRGNEFQVQVSNR